MAHINLINMIETYIIPWGRYRAQAYYSPMGCKILWLTKGVHVCTRVCFYLQVHLCVLPQSWWGWCGDNHAQGRMWENKKGSPSGSSGRWVFPRAMSRGVCEGWLSSFRVISSFPRLCLHHQHNLGDFVPHFGALQTNLWSLWLPARILEVASKVGSSYPWFQLPPTGPSVRICCHAGRRTSRKMLLCLFLPAVLGSCLLCLYPDACTQLWWSPVTSPGCSVYVSFFLPLLFPLRMIFAGSQLFMMLKSLWSRAKLLCCDKAYVREVGILNINDFLIVWLHIAHCWKMGWAGESNPFTDQTQIPIYEPFVLAPLP